MKMALNQFEGNLQRANDLCSLYKALRNQTTTALELSDILRSAIVMAVSALDHYIHQAVRIGMLDAYTGNFKQTEAFQRFQVSLASVAKQTADPTSSDWLDQEIHARHGWLSFEHPDKIADALRLVCDVNVWEDVGPRMGKSATDVKARLKTIVDRRNKIAHESDVNPSYSGERWPIDTCMIDDTIQFMRHLGASLYGLIMERRSSP